MALVPVYMPKYGMTMTAGIIVEWLKNEGDRVSQGDPLVVIETEKVSTEIEAPTSGIIVELTFAPEAEVEVGNIIAYIEE
jgi:pyruvate/2-oxoglutarate dehydrogenase complex dihydrolipoamide acyltransferase (E2) component